MSVSAEERTLRDLIPGWEPVRPLTEAEGGRGVLPSIDGEAEPKLAHDACAALAKVYDHLGERDRALSTAREVLE